MNLRTLLDEIRASLGDSPGALRIRQQRGRLVDGMRQLTDAAQREKRSLTDGERVDFDDAETLFSDLNDLLKQAEARERRENESAVPIRRSFTDSFYRQPSSRGANREHVALRSSDSVADHVERQGYTFDSREELGLGKMIRGMLLGDWRGAEMEQRAMLESSAGSGGVLVPAPMASRVIDIARARTRVMQAGALTVPMDSSTLKIGRQTGDPDLAWHVEGDADISESGLTFDSVTLTAQTLPCLVKLSVELLEDVDNIDSMVTNSIAAAMALEVDRVALRGSGTAPEPRGLRNTSGVTILNADESGGANGAPATWRTLVRAVASVKGANYDPNAAIHAVRTEVDLGTQTNANGDYLNPPPLLANVARLDTTQVPTNLTKGTSTDASEMYVGQWNQLMIGMRTSFQIQPLNELYADSLERGIMCYIRMDVAPAQPAAFTVVDGITATPAP